MKNKPHYQKGNFKDVALIFSCPGRHEKDQGHPIAGATGKNFDGVLNYLKLHGKFKNQKLRSDFRITNAFDGIEYLGSTNRTQASNKEIRNEKNLDRLANELNDIDDVIIFFGKKAEYALKLLIRSDKHKSILEGKTLIITRHLSPRSFNFLAKKQEDRITIIGEHILAQWK